MENVTQNKKERGGEIKCGIVMKRQGSTTAEIHQLHTEIHCVGNSLKLLGKLVIVKF